MTRLDEEIRSRLWADVVSTRTTAPASTVLEGLRPRLRTARRLRRAAIGATGVVLIGTAAVAFQAGLGNRTPTMIRASDQLEPDPYQQTSGSSETDGRAVPSDPAGSTQSEVAAVQTVIAEPSSSSSAPSPTSPGIDDRPVVSIPGPTPTATTRPGTITATSLDSVAESSTSTSTPPVAPAWTAYRIDSACGSVDVRYRGDRVEVVGVSPNDGFEVDVKNDGPEEVEVGLHGGDNECELKARVVGGKLVPTVHGPGGDGSDDNHSDD